jgi:TolB-like protein/Flp pilus assembly protein TadD
MVRGSIFGGLTVSDESKQRSTAVRWMIQLRERHVLRVLAVYVVGAWIALQVADVAVLPALGIPDVGMRYVVIAAAVGLVIACVLAWRYEITRSGIVPHAARAAESPAQAFLRRADRIVIVSMAALSLLTVAAAVAKLLDLMDSASQLSMSQPGQMAMAEPGSLAVLPFANLNSDPELEYFADGLTDELLNRLASVPSLRVTARTSAFSFKGRDVSAKEIGAALGVAHIVEGTVRRSQGDLRVSVQLVNTSDGYRVWSSTFDRQLSDAFAIQEEIAQNVLDSLQGYLTPKHQPSNGALSYRPPSSPEAHDLYLRARHLYTSFQLERMDKAIAYYEEAIRLDPRFAAAYIGLADALLWRRRVAETSPTDPVNARIPVLLRKALEIDPGSGDAHALLGKELRLAHDFRGAERELQRAEALSPNGYYVVEGMMAYYMLGGGWPPERAIAYARKGRQLDPLNPWAVIHVAQAHWHAHQYGEALLELERVFEIDPNFWLAHEWRVTILLDLERHKEALSAAQRAVELRSSSDTLSLLAVTHLLAGNVAEGRAIIARLPAEHVRNDLRICMALQDHECALDALERHFAEQTDWMPEVLHYRFLLPLHGEPRFQRIVQLLGQERRVEHAARMNRPASDRS